MKGKQHARGSGGEGGSPPLRLYIGLSMKNRKIRTKQPLLSRGSLLEGTCHLELTLVFSLKFPQCIYAFILCV